MSEKADEAIAFIDSNLCLEFPYGDHTVWAKMTNAKRARVVVCRGVLVEVEEKKTDDRLREASLWWVKKVAEVRQNGGAPVELHKTATLVYYKSPTFLSAATARGDEAILVQAAEYRDQNASVPFYFITDDGGAKLFAEDEGFNVLAPLDFEFMKKARVEKSHDQIELEEFRAAAEQRPKIRAVVTGGDEGVMLVNKGTLKFKIYKPKADHFQQQVNERIPLRGGGLWPDYVEAQRLKHSQASLWALREQSVQDESARTLSIKLKLRNDGGELSKRAILEASYDPQFIMAATAGVGSGGNRTRSIPFPVGVVPDYTEDNIALGKRIVRPQWEIKPAVVVPSNLAFCHEATFMPGEPHVNPLGKIKFVVDNLGPFGKESEEFEVTFTYKSWNLIKPLAITLTLVSEDPPYIDPPRDAKRQNVITLVPTVVSPTGEPLTKWEEMGDVLEG